MDGTGTDRWRRHGQTVRGHRGRRRHAAEADKGAGTHVIEEQLAGSVHGLGKRAGPEMCGQGPAMDDVHERRMTGGVDEWCSGQDATMEGQGMHRSGVGRNAYG